MKKTAYLAFFLAVVCGVCGVALAAVNSITAPIIANAGKVTYVDGTYSGSAQGFGGDVTVTLTVADGKITELTAEGTGETPAIGGAAIPTLTEAILASGSIDGVDTVGGATITSNAVFDAIRTALASAGGSGSGSVADGTYSATGQGFGGEISVEFTVSGGQVTDITIKGEKETPNFGGVAIETITEQILSSGSLEFDAVSGSTFTSTGVADAISAALEGGN